MVSVNASVTVFKSETIAVGICNPEKPPDYRHGYRLTVTIYRPGYRHPEWASGIRVGFRQLIRNYMSVTDNKLRNDNAKSVSVTPRLIPK